MMGLVRWLAVLTSAIAPIFAHPMGNFSVSRYMRFEAVGAELRLTYALDLAEIPTFEMTHQWGLDNPTPSDIERRAAKEMRNWAKALTLSANGSPLQSQMRGIRAVVTDGAGGMPVVLVTAQMTAPLPPESVRLAYRDPNFADRSGWKEIVLQPNRARAVVSAKGTAAEVSKALTDYPIDPAYTPPQSIAAEIEWAALPASLPVPSVPTEAAVEPSPAPKPVPQGTLAKGDFLSRLLSQEEIPFSLALAGLVAAFGLGAVHAMSPGHGKTLMAAYLVGSRGTIKHAAILGGLVTFTHTISVFLLGLATLFLSKYFLPEKIVPWLGAISGATIVIVGISLFRKRLRSLQGKHAPAHAHVHSHGDLHHHHDHDSGHSHDHGDGHHHHHLPQGEITPGSLVALGVSGGLAPCPSALVILLSAIAIGRTGYGLLLLITFSLGLALVLMAVGSVVLYAKHLVPSSETFAQGRVAKLIPIASAAVIVFVGVVMTGASLGVIKTPGS